MRSSAILLLLTVASVCGEAAAQRRVGYVTVVSNTAVGVTLRKLCCSDSPRFCLTWNDARETMFKIEEMFPFLVRKHVALDLSVHKLCLPEIIRS